MYGVVCINFGISFSLFFRYKYKWILGNNTFIYSRLISFITLYYKEQQKKRCPTFATRQLGRRVYRRFPTSLYEEHVTWFQQLHLAASHPLQTWSEFAQPYNLQIQAQMMTYNHFEIVKSFKKPFGRFEAALMLITNPLHPIHQRTDARSGHPQPGCTWQSSNRPNCEVSRCATNHLLLLKTLGHEGILCRPSF